jgi:hypothetical protein
MNGRPYNKKHISGDEHGEILIGIGRGRGNRLLHYYVDVRTHNPD